MKHLSIAVALIFYSSLAYSQAPNPPEELCYNYDRAGNRFQQNPAWISIPIPITCTPNDPDNAARPNFGFMYAYPPQTEENLFPNLPNTPWNVGDNGHVNGPFSNPNGDPVYALAAPSSLVFKDPPKNSSFISIIPNPNVGQFSVYEEGFNSEGKMIYILDNKGVLLFEREYVDGYVGIGEFAAGEYILILKDKDRQMSVKFVKTE